MGKRAKRRAPGRGVWVDPTENTKALNKASSRHLAATLKLEISGLRREIKSQAKLVSKIRKIDRLNQQLIDERLQAGTDKVSATIELTAKTLSANQAETAKTLANSHDANFGRLAEKVAALERVQYQGAGQAGVRDPQIDALMAEVQEIKAGQNTGTGQRAGLNQAWLILGSVVTLLAGLYFLGSKFFGH